MQQAGSVEVKNWADACAVHGRYLFGEKVEYSWQTARSLAFLTEATAVPMFSHMDKPMYISKCTGYIIQGPYDLTNDHDKISVTCMLDRIQKLHQVGYFKSDERFGTAAMVLESELKQDRAYLMYGYGRDPKCFRSMSTDSELVGHSPLSSSPRRFCKLLISLAMKYLFGIPENHLNHIYSSSSDAFFLMKLDSVDTKDAKDEQEDAKRLWYEKWFTGSGITSEQRAPFEMLEKCVQTESVATGCVEYMRLWRTRVEHAFGPVSVEMKRWTNFETRYARPCFRRSGMNQMPTSLDGQCVSVSVSCFPCPWVRRNCFPARLPAACTTNVTFRWSNRIITEERSVLMTAPVCTCTNGSDTTTDCRLMPVVCAS